MKIFMPFFLMFAVLLTPVVSNVDDYVENDTDEIEIAENYKIYDEENNYLTERNNILLGDIIIDSEFNSYEIIFIDDENLTAIAKFKEALEKPKIRKKNLKQIGNIELDKTIGLYSTHNDESYIIGDGTESVYGTGGIHDIAKQLSNSLLTKKINTIHNETLHIPHNSSAYTRSRTTAKKLLSEGSTAIFDIHRDGASRSFYLTEHNGKKYSKIRIVVGQSNPNKEQNLQLALWLCSVAETLYPWLIADIYYGSGKYNQDLSSKALLFEMGCHKIEKEYVENSVPLLADVIYTTLFATNVEEETGDLTIGEISSESTETIDEVLENKSKPSNIVPTVIVVAITLTLLFGYYVVRKKI